MYPTLTAMLGDLLGIDIPLPIQTYGFFLAMGFVVAGLWLFYEMRRMERIGILQGAKEKFVIGEAATFGEILVNALVGFAVGYKGLAALVAWRAFCDNPQEFLISAKGSLLGGIVLAAIMAFWRYYEKEKQRSPQPQIVEETVYPHQRIGDLIMIAAVFGILGSKIFTWIEDIDGFLRDPIGALFAFSGLTFYGGLIVAAIAVSLYARSKKIPFLHLLDITAPALIVAYGIGRLGCHFSGDGDWGIVNLAAKPLAFLPDWAWAYTYPNNVNNDGIPIPGCMGRYCSQLPEPVYPTSVYEFLMSTAIFCLLVVLRKKITHIPGLLFCIYLLFNGMERFCIETIRVNIQYPILGTGIMLSQAQIIALCLSLSGIIGTVILLLNKKKHPNANHTTMVN